MRFDLRAETLAFLDRAPVVYMTNGTATAARARVFQAFATPTSWPRWFPNVQQASYTSAGPTGPGVGTIREAQVGGTHWVEEMIAWDDARRLAWTVTRTSVPFAHAQVECFEFADAPGATAVRWTLGLEPRCLAKLGAPFAARLIDRLFQRALQNLDAHLRSADTPSGSTR